MSKLKQKIAITGKGSISPFGVEQAEVLANIFSKKTFIKKIEGDFVAPIDKENQFIIEELKKSNKHFARLDTTVLFAILASRQATKQAGWQHDFGVNIGSSRGATNLLEENFSFFKETGKASPLSSPTTTLGNISSWVSQDLGANGLAFSHSITCSSAGHAFLNGIAWIQAGLMEKMLVGGSESPLTKFTIEQMKALKVYAQEENNYPCRPLDFNKQSNTMCLGEGASVFCIEKESKNALAYIEGIGFASEKIEHATAISNEAEAIQKSMEMALDKRDKVDLIIAHAPGTLAGDESEMNAIKKVFGENHPLVISNKWQIGHTFGASMGFSVELAIEILNQQKIPQIPYLPENKIPTNINKIIVNSIGFGGNAVSLLISRN